MVILPVLAGTTVNNGRVSLEQSFSARMHLLMAAGLLCAFMCQVNVSPALQ